MSKSEIYDIDTNSGKCVRPLPFLTENEQENFDSIGYSGKTLDGKKMSRSEYLNSLNKGNYSIIQTKFDHGDFSESFTIVKVVEKKLIPEEYPKFKIQFLEKTKDMAPEEIASLVWQYGNKEWKRGYHQGRYNPNFDVELN